MAITTTGMRPVAHRPGQVHELFATFATAGDVEALISIYEPDALIFPQPGVRAEGIEELRAACAQLCALGARFTASTEAVHVAGDLALASARWSADVPGGPPTGGRTTEVLRRQPDGRWLVVIDDPQWIE
jgi:ketosteroid isomerase-like protein